MLSVENFSALATVYARLGLRNLLSVENFSALAPAYHPAWTEKSAVCRKFFCPRTSIPLSLGREICCLQAISLPSHQHTSRLGLRNLLSVENFSALAPAYPRLRQKNLLSVENFSAHAPVYARLRLKNLLPGINFSAHKTSYPPA